MIAIHAPALYQSDRRMMDFQSAAAPAMESKSSARSCTTCSKAKAKCVRRPGQEICERCARLRKECHSREPVLRRRKIVKTTRAAQLEQLENKIEHLVNALSTTQTQRGLSTDVGQPSPPVSQTSEPSAAQKRSEILSSFCSSECVDRFPDDAPPTSATVNTTQSPGGILSTQITSLATTPEDQDYLGVSIQEAEILLDRYRRLMAHGNPFVVIPAHITARQLYAEKPFLLHSIVTVAYFHELPRQQTMVKQLMRDVSERVLINAEKSMDVLQGVLVFMFWYYPHLFWAQQMTNLLHIAISLSIDMNIDRAPNAFPEFKSGAGKPMGAVAPRVPTLEEYRAIAGVFYHSSLLSSSFKKLGATKYTKFLDDALSMLEQEREFESDLYLVQMVRLQHLIEETHTAETPSAPMQMFVKAFNVDLERLKKSDPCKEANILLKLQYINSEILVWELALIDLQENSAKPLHSHLDDLYRCVEAIKAFWEVFRSIPTSAYLTLPFSAFAQFAHAFLIVLKLASLEVDGWDMKDLEEHMIFPKVIEEFADRFDGATRSAPDGTLVNNDSFGKWAQRMRWMKQVYESKFAQDGEKGEPPVDGNEPPKTILREATESQMPAITNIQQPTPPDDVLAGDFFSYWDENFWQSFAGDMDLGFPDMQMT